MGCQFCSTFDFSTANIETNGKFSHINLALCNTRFPKEQQFNFCPNCGKLLNQELERKGVYVVDRDYNGDPTTVNYYHVLVEEENFKIVCTFLGEKYENYSELIEYVLRTSFSNNNVELHMVPNKDCYNTSHEANEALEDELDKIYLK